MSEALRTRLLLVTAVGVALAIFARLALVSVEQLGAPFDLVHETPNLASLQLIADGLSPYGAYGPPHFVITLYTPLYHWLAAGLPISADNPFFWGRILSMLCMLGAGALPFLAWRRGGSLVVPLLASAVFFAFRPVVINTAFLRNDPLALLLAASAVIVLARHGGARAAMVSALLCCFALFTKQSYVAAPLACLLTLLAIDRRGALFFAASGAVIGAVMAGGATLAWGGDFWFSTVVAPNNPFSLDGIPALLAHIAVQPAFVLVVGAAMLASARAVALGAWRPTSRDSVYAVYAGVSVVVLGATLPKLGATTNYLFEPMLALVLWLAHAARDLDLRTLGRGRAGAATAVVIATLGLELALAKAAEVSLVIAPLAAIEEVWTGLRARLAPLNPDAGPVLSLHSARPNFSIQDRAVLNDPFLYGILWRSGVLPVEPLVESVRRAHFAAILLPKGTRTRPGPDPVRRIERVIVRRYRLASAGEFFDIYVPDERR